VLSVGVVSYSHEVRAGVLSVGVVSYSRYDTVCKIGYWATTHM
jgi:hypothetical protein